MKFLLRWATHVVAGLAVASLCSVIITIVLDSTLLSSHYIEQQASQTNSYSRLSSALSAELAKDMGNATPQVQTALQQILTPAVLQQKINSALDQLQAYFKGNGGPPVIDLTGLANQARAAGLQVPANSPLDKPITFTNNQQIKGVSKRFEGIKVETIIATLVFLALLLFLSWERHRYGTLPDIAMICGIIIGIVATAFLVLPSVINKHLKLNTGSNAFASIAHDLGVSISHNLGEKFAIIAVVLFIVGLAARILVAKFKPKAAPTAKMLTAKPAR